MINILFCGNSGVFDGMLTCALSLFKRSATKEPFHFMVFTMDLHELKEKYTPVSDKQISFFERVIKEYNPENSVIKVDVTPFYNAEFKNSPNEQCYCSPYTLIRLFADKVDGVPDKFLYLDVDVMANRDITLLYDIDVSQVEYAAANDHYGKYILNACYINAGVLLFNMKKCRETGIFAKARELIKVRKLVFADQSALIRSTTSYKLLPQKFNDQKFLHKHTVIRHFSQRLFYLPYPHVANIKQWRVSDVHRIFKYYVFDDILYEYIYLKKVFEREQGENR